MINGNRIDSTITNQRTQRLEVPLKLLTLKDEGVLMLIGVANMFP